MISIEHCSRPKHSKWNIVTCFCIIWNEQVYAFSSYILLLFPQICVHFLFKFLKAFALLYSLLRLYMFYYLICTSYKTLVVTSYLVWNSIFNHQGALPPWPRQGALLLHPTGTFAPSNDLPWRHPCFLR